MKYKLKKRKTQNFIMIIFLMLLFSFVIYSSEMLRRKDPVLVVKMEVEQVNTYDKRNEGIDQYIENNLKDKLVETVDLSQHVTSVLIKEEQKYKAYLFNYENGEEIELSSLIKKEQINNFNNKIKELLYLKYPTFIADVLQSNSGRNVYHFKENELIIYYYDYTIVPNIIDELFLRVNYNEIYKYLDFTVKLDQEYQNEDGSIIDNSKKYVAITFDDGPSDYTSSLVDVLYNNKAKSTFFFLGNKLNNYRDTVIKVKNAGHEIGYHSYAHANFKRQKIETIINEYNLSNELLQGIIGDTFKIVRPPYGSTNENIQNNLDMPFILWNIDTNDWRYKDINYLVNHVLENVSDGSIVLFHDTYSTSIEAVTKLLPELYSRGYQVVTVSTLASIKGINLNNHELYRSFN